MKKYKKLDMEYLLSDEFVDKVLNDNEDCQVDYDEEIEYISKTIDRGIQTCKDVDEFNDYLLSFDFDPLNFKDGVVKYLDEKYHNDFYELVDIGIVGFGNDDFISKMESNLFSLSKNYYHFLNTNSKDDEYDELPFKD